jgi:hypothetical protein
MKSAGSIRIPTLCVSGVRDSLLGLPGQAELRLRCARLLLVLCPGARETFCPDDFRPGRPSPHAVYTPLRATAALGHLPPTLIPQ